MDLKSYLDDLPRGGQAQFAHNLDVSRSYLSQLASGQAPISPERAVQIEELSEGKVTRQDMRPDDWHKIWPELRPDFEGASVHACANS